MPNDAKELSVHVTEESIALLIDRFYVRIRQDPVLAEVFEAAIAPDEWPEHLATMRRFLVVSHADIWTLFRQSGSSA